MYFVLPLSFSYTYIIWNMCFFKDQVRVSTISFRGRGTRGGWGNPGTVEEYDNNSRFYIYLPPKQRKMSYHPRYLNHCMPQTKARKYSTMTLCVNSAKREILPKLLQFCIQIRRIPVWLLHLEAISLCGQLDEFFNLWSQGLFTKILANSPILGN